MDACQLSVAFQVGALSRTDVASWVDSQVELADSVAGPLLELCTLAPKTDSQIVELLDRLAGERDNRRKIVWLAGAVREGRISLERAIRFLESSSCDWLSDNERQEVLRLADGYSLASSGTWGTLDDIHRDFEAFVSDLESTYGALADGVTETLYRPVGPVELEAIAATGYRRFPPRLADQPIFYPVCNERYATQIVREWNVPRLGAGFVTRFEVRKSFLERYPVRIVGDRTHAEYWIPAEDLEAFNNAIVGEIEVVASFGKCDPGTTG